MNTELAECPVQSVREKAAEYFLDRLKSIQEARVELRGGQSPADQVIHVFLPSRNSSAWTQVRALEGEVVDRFPRSGLSIRLSEMRRNL
jgi:hypothetical protein